MITFVVATLFVYAPSLEGSKTLDDPPDTLSALHGKEVLVHIKK